MSTTSRSSSPLHSSPATPESSDPSEFPHTDPLILQLDRATWDHAAAAARQPWLQKDFHEPQHATGWALQDIINDDALEPNQSIAPEILYTATPQPPQPQPHRVPASSGRRARTVTEVIVRDGAVYPPRESCSNLPVLFPSLPASGTKSRVETQIRLEIELADTPTAVEGGSHGRVASWKWLRLPRGTTTKKRPRREGKFKADPEDILDVGIEVVGTSDNGARLACCEGCLSREAKRLARKMAARVRPARSDSEDVKDNRPPGPEDEDKMIQFNCAEFVDFSSGMANLPMRLTCYCRHHREKTGFLVKVTMKDITGRLVAAGTTPPIMITDDHKSVLNAKHLQLSRATSAEDQDTDMHTERVGKRRHAGDSESKRRAKPYDRTPRNVAATPVSAALTPAFLTAPPSPSITSAPSPVDGSILPGFPAPIDLLFGMSNPQDLPQSPYTMPNSSYASPKRSPSPAAAFSPFPMLYPISAPPFQCTGQPPPKIHRLIPAAGPVCGGIEITVLGSNFTSANIQCFFGGTRASSTERWSDNTLVCVLPPHANPGTVVVTIERQDDGALSDEPDVLGGNLFIYVDDIDRRLMEIALKVVGMKMTGMPAEAKDVARSIVASAVPGAGNVVDLSCMPSALLLPIVDLSAELLKLFTTYEPDASALKLCTAEGHTVLHLAAMLGFVELVDWLLAHGAQRDVQDTNGCTALHLAVLAGARACAAKLVHAGADTTLRSRSGQTAAQLASDWITDLIPRSVAEPPSLHVAPSASGEDGDEEWDDEDSVSASSDGDNDVLRAARIPLPRTRRGTRANSVSSVGAAPPPMPAPDTPSKEEATPPSASLDEKVPGLAWLRKLAQLPAPQGIMPAGPWHMPAVPWPMPAVQWQMPTIPVFFVPAMPTWPAWGEKRPLGEKGADASAATGGFWAYGLSMDPLRAQWGRLQAATAGAATQPAPAETQDAQPAALDRRRVSRTLGYDTPPVAAAEVNQYGACELPPRRRAKKDRMFLWFWLPILLLGVVWALYTVLPVAYAHATVLRTVRRFMPLREVDY